MTERVHLAAAVIMTLLACSAAGAQTRGGRSGMAPMPARVAPVRSMPAGRASGARAPRQATVIAPNGRAIPSDSFGNSVNFGDQIGVPGLGFDYPHLAAVSGNFRNNPPGFGRGEHHRENFVTPLFFGGFGGFPYYSDSSDYQDYQPQPQQQQQPQVIVIQQPVTAQPPAPAPQEPSTEAAAPAPSTAPVPEVGEFILVRRDGRVLFASAFSVSGAQVQYVTPEGMRRTLPLSELDTAATQDMNEARGTTLQFHN